MNPGVINREEPSKAALIKAPFVSHCFCVAQQMFAYQILFSFLGELPSFSLMSQTPTPFSSAQNGL